MEKELKKITGLKIVKKKIDIKIPDISLPEIKDEEYPVYIDKENKTLFIYYQNLILENLRKEVNFDNVEEDSSLIEETIETIVKNINETYFNSDVVEDISFLEGACSIEKSKIEKFTQDRRDLYLLELNKTLNLAKKEVLKRFTSSSIEEEETIVLEKEKVEGQLSFLLEVIKEIKEKLKLVVADNDTKKVVKTKIEDILLKSQEELLSYLDRDTKSLNLMIGLGEYTSQLSNWLNYLVDDNVKISDSFFEVSNLFDTAANYISSAGRTMESHIEVEFKERGFDNVSSLHKEKWDVLADYLSSADVYFSNREWVIKNQIKFQKENQEQLNSLNIALKYVGDSKVEIIEELKKIYIKADSVVEMKEAVKELIEKTSEKFNEVLIEDLKMESLVFDNQYKVNSINNLKMNLKSYIKKLKKVHHIVEEGGLDAVKSRTMRYQFIGYKNGRNLPLTDIILKGEENPIEKMIEIKNLRISKNNEIIFPFYLSKTNKKNLLDNEIADDYVKENQKELFMKQTHRLDTLQIKLNLKKDNFEYYVNIFDQKKAKKTTYVIPLKEFEDFFNSEFLIDNSQIFEREERAGVMSQKNGKLGIRIDVDFFKEYFEKNIERKQTKKEKEEFKNKKEPIKLIS